jgi:cytochrome c oxidase assembly factor CtaG/cytochrome c2
MLVLTAAAVILLAGAAPAIAHAAAPDTGHPLAWSFEPSVLAGLAAAAVCYAAGVRRIQQRDRPAPLLRAREAAAFAAGLAVLFVALVSPLDSIAGQLFWVHMVQHLLLLLVAAPLLVIGRPALVFLWAFSRHGRRRVGQVWAGLGLRVVIDALMHPAIVWILFCGAFLVWHFPGPYQAALRHQGLHTLEHLSFLVTALMFWSIVIEPSGRRRLGHGPTLVFVMTAAILSGLPGALIALAPRPLYPAHAAGVASWGLTALEDQQLAGIVMWIPGGFVYLVAAGWVFVNWLKEGGARRTAIARRAALGLPALLLIPFSLGGCDDNGSRAVAANIGGDPHQGAALIKAYGCGSCHTIPGVADANGLVGPPLLWMGRRVYIAGVLRNTPDNMILWLRHPQRIVPGNAMPEMGLSEKDARNVAAYLYTLR